MLNFILLQQGPLARKMSERIPEHQGPFDGTLNPLPGNDKERLRVWVQRDTQIRCSDGFCLECWNKMNEIHHHLAARIQPRNLAMELPAIHH